MSSLFRVSEFRAAVAAAALLGACAALSGCHVSSHKNGKNDNVDIGTPFGSMQVKTNDNADTAAIGLTPYPGAVPVKDEDGDKSSADVNLNFGNFHLGVKAATFQTPDAKDKVIAFYRKDLAKYGDVIACKGNEPVGTPVRTSQGLTCEDKGHTKVNAHGDVNMGWTKNDAQLELKTGSQEHQHVVAIETKNGGTRIGLVALTLPVHFGDNDKDAE